MIRASGALRTEKLYELAHLLTREALSEDLPKQFCEALSDEMPGWVGMLAYESSEKPPVELATTRLPMDQWAAFCEYYWSVNPVPAALKSAGLWDATSRTSDLIPDPDLRRTEYYNDFLMPAGLRWLAGLGVVLSNGHRVNVVLLRGDGQGGDYTDAEIRWLDRLRLFLKSAFELRSLAAELGPASTVRDLGPKLKAPALIFQKGRRAEPLNEAGERLLGVRGTAAEEAVLALGGGRPRIASRWAVSSGMLAPAGAPGAHPGGILVAFNAGNPPTHPRALLQSRFGLTPAESAVAVALIDGLTYREIAEEFDVSFHTVHSQVRAIYQKAGVRSARQFAAIACGGRGPITKG